MTVVSHPVVLPVLIPLIAAFLLPILGRNSETLARLAGKAAVLLTALSAIGLAWQVGHAGPVISAMGGFNAPLGIVFYADRLALLFLFALIVSIWLFWPRAEDGAVKAYTLMLTLLGGGAGLVLSGDLFNIFVFYEIVAVASYGLVASGDTARGYGAALRYLLISALGSSLALLGIALVYAATGTLNLADLALLAPERLTGVTGVAAFVLLVLGFGVKAELFPVNSWVPEVYATAPVRVTSLLAGTVSKLAIVVILRLLVLVFPLAATQGVLLTIGVLGVIAGELIAYRAADLNRTFAWSSVAQLGLVAIAFSIPGPAGIAAGIAIALHHALVKPAFFFIADKWRGPVDGLAGAAKAAPVAAVLFVILSLSIIGIPPLPGFWAKYLLLGGALAAEAPVYGLVVAVVLASVVIEAAYLFRAVSVIYTSAPEKHALRFKLAELGPAMVLVLGLLVVTLYSGSIGKQIAAAANVAADRPAVIARVLGGVN
jgi:formate hydrogenlyase subunit 3/multisubunit Na+/H+ antiporter MnhD subunit